MKTALENVLNRIKDSVRETPLILEGKKIGELTFIEITQESRERLRAVDGGSAPLLQTPNACVLFVRIVGVTLDATNKKTIEKQEGFVVTTFTNEEHIRATYYDLEGKEDELFTLALSELKQVEETTVLLHVANSARKQLEWKCVLQKEVVTIWDGIFTAQNSAEKVLAKQVVEKSSVVGLAKTTTAIGNWGIFAKAPQTPWYAQAFGHTYFTKLHEKSTHYFRIDASSTKYFSVLRSWAKDPIFLGYPYPLILADQLARVSNTELSSLKIRLQSIFGKENLKLLNENATNAHTILDSIQF